MIEVKYSPESLVDLQQVVEFVEAKNPYAARRIAIDLQEGVSKLKQFPQIGLPVIKAPDPKTIRDLYVSDYTVRYLITDESIYILRVWHNKEKFITSACCRL
jgi:plasmid stabilization system protein ParE